MPQSLFILRLILWIKHKPAFSTEGSSKNKHTQWLFVLFKCYLLFILFHSNLDKGNCQHVPKGFHHWHLLHVVWGSGGFVLLLAHKRNRSPRNNSVINYSPSSYPKRSSGKHRRYLKLFKSHSASERYYKFRNHQSSRGSGTTTNTGNYLIITCFKRSGLILRLSCKQKVLGRTNTPDWSHRSTEVQSLKPKNRLPYWELSSQPTKIRPTRINGHTIGGNSRY